jgi:hypothetical protein
MTITANRPPLHARTPTPEEVVWQRLRMLGLGLLAAVIVVDAVHGPLTRWRAFGLRVIEGMDPLDRPGTGLVEVVSDLLSASDGFSLVRALRR